MDLLLRFSPARRRPSPLQYCDSAQEESALIEKHIRVLARPDEPVRILEAGCGRRWTLKLDGLRYELTGVDRDRAALDIRKDEHGDLDAIVEGDLHTVELPEDNFDVVYSCYVLEHVDGAETVLAKFVRWLRPGGLIIVKVPDPRSVQGFITRVTPHWFHVFYYRYLLGRPHAGQPGFEPYPVVYDEVVSRAGMRRFCRLQGLTLLGEYGDRYLRQGRPRLRAPLHIFKQLVAMLSLGTLTARHTNLLFILRKP